MNKVFISHIRSDNWTIQTNDEHQEGVASLASEFANDFSMGEFYSV